MTPEQFAYWLQGALEVIDPKYGLDAKQVQVIRDHLALVFEKVTPERSGESEFSKILDQASKDFAGMDEASRKWFEDISRRHAKEHHDKWPEFSLGNTPNLDALQC